MANIQIKKSNLVVIAYAFFIIAISGVFLLQSNSIGAVKNQDTAKAVSAVKTQEADKSAPIFISAEPVYTYDVVDKSQDPKLKVGGKTTLALKIRNTGNRAWESAGDNPVYLGTSRPIDRDTVFYSAGNRGWLSGNRIMMDKKIVKPGETVNFIFSLTAPNKSGIYREFFSPIMENLKWLEDKGIYWDIEVRDPNKPDEKLNLSLSGGPVKYIKIKLEEQHLYVYENGLVKYDFLTSTGRPGMDTPTGTFAIQNQFPVQYSPEYELYMDNWMAITPGGAIGIHSLPYWPAKNGGRIYEGEGHLGTKVSHGCIRVSLENSKLLYDWAEVGMPVIVEN
ncbi:MAG: L,D-transpeptidase family protein [Patescibacteria group bacterium]|nr:L,D-transpeptidase family protein [Patescibacteria group bacterium]